MKFGIPLLSLAFVLLANSCKKDQVEDQIITTVDPLADEKQAVKQSYADMAFALYDDSYLATLSLQSAIINFASNPTAQNFEACKSAWLAAREIYGLTETFRFAEGPIDNEADGPEGLINAWPMDEAYVDYVVGNDNAGIINNPLTYPTIDATTLLNANENGGETNIALGYHAIEFLLWGQDLSATTAGNRPYTDFITGGSASNQSRRLSYLVVAADILVAGLQQVRDAWDPAIANNYRTTLLAQNNATFLRDVFNSLKVMSGFELSGERMYVAYENANQEDEHSCFSDNTHRDIYLNAEGMYKLYTGSYTRINGEVLDLYSLDNLVEAISVDVSNITELAFTNSLTEISEMYIPFDQAIVLENERPKVLEAVEALQLLDDQLTITASTAFAINF
jgi:putative iron-regulated protein